LEAVGLFPDGGGGGGGRRGLNNAAFPTLMKTSIKFYNYEGLSK
jgi:hypothetical protein